MADKKNLPTTDALKERFKAGSIPLQSDFADLIDMADAGASAVGLAAGQPGPTGLGMRLSPDGRLELNVSGSYNFNSDTDIETTTPVTIDTSNNRPVVDLGYGLKGSSVGLSVRASTGIVANGDGVSVDAGVIANADAGAKAVGKYTGQDGKPGLGMRLTSDGKLELNIDKKDFDYSSEEDGSVFIAVDKGTNKPVLDLGKGLTRSSRHQRRAAGRKDRRYSMNSRRQTIITRHPIVRRQSMRILRDGFYRHSPSEVASFSRRMRQKLFRHSIKFINISFTTTYISVGDIVTLK